MQVPFGFANLRAKTAKLIHSKGILWEQRGGNRIIVATPELSAKPASTAAQRQVKSGAKVLQIFTRLSWIFTHGSLMRWAL
jgi:hypothetical protein